MSDIQKEMKTTEGAKVSFSSLASQWKVKTGNSVFNAPHKMSEWRGNTWEVEHELLIDPSNISIQQIGGTFNIDITSNVPWWIGFRDGTPTTISPTSGPGNRTIQVTVSRNDSQNSKLGRIEITTGQRSEICTWTQPGGPVIAGDGSGLGSNEGPGGGGNGSGGGLGGEGGEGDSGVGFVEG
ncbi:MAG: BACON domain-containing protein [Bacteroidota bacterium]